MESDYMTNRYRRRGRLVKSCGHPKARQTRTPVVRTLSTLCHGCGAATEMSWNENTTQDEVW